MKIVSCFPTSDAQMKVCSAQLRNSLHVIALVNKAPAVISDGHPVSGQDALQEGIAALISLVQRSGTELSQGHQGQVALLATAKCAACALRGHILLREVASAAAVLLAACMAVPHVSPNRVSATLARALGLLPGAVEIGTSKAADSGTVEAALNVEVSFMTCKSSCRYLQLQSCLADIYMLRERLHDE
jgi:hypothetical protein